MNKTHNNSNEFATFGQIHLNNTNLKKSTFFWTKIVGMKLRKFLDGCAEFGTENKTLVVIHQTAKTPFQKGYSGLYHFAIHLPNEAEFASVLNRLIVKNYPFSPVDHTMSKSLYIDDPDGINIEFTLETPERFKRVITDGGLKIEDAQGNIKSASEYLDIKEVLNSLTDKNVDKTLTNDTYFGHIHLYANNIEKSNSFYQKTGFIPFNNLPQFMYADLGAGGAYQHRIALNSWHGIDRPMAPIGSAGMKYFQIILKSKNDLKKIINHSFKFNKTNDGYWCKDPTGNKILFTNS